MKKQVSCADEFDPNSLRMEQAVQRIHDTITTVNGSERIFIRNALGRILDKDVLSPINVPAYRNSAMDGYAINSKDLPSSGHTSLKIVARIFAGHPFEGAIRQGECARIMTGAPMPEGTDTVIMQEHVETDGENIRIDDIHSAGQNVRQAGEDLAKNGIALAKGTQIKPADMGLIASLGIAEVSVKRRIKVAFFSTGDELCSIGDQLQEGQIFDSNRYTLYGMLQNLGVEVIDMGIIADNKDLIRQAYSDASNCADVVITSGGVSVGEADFVKSLLEELGQVDFWKIAMKPGKPLTFGRLNKSYFFGLPGNPVSAMVTFYQFVKPGLLKLSGRTDYQPTTIRLKCADKLKKAPGRIDFQRGIMFQNENGDWMVRSTGPQGSHILNSMSLANCFIVLPLESNGIAAGEEVDVQVFEGIV
ncbi:MAG: molybdopterin molybdotransferase MoeA [Gammaproteobacteria bacterium]|nr:molybdopterin molybdotransferase MoeA [Gammaproteobacteria bacterium]